jgi:replicative DNA helicase
MKKAILNCVDLLNIGDFDGIKHLINRTANSGQTKDLGHDYGKDIETRYREDDRKPIPFPWKTFNNLTQGGMGKGDLILIFGNPKGGKSWIAVDCAAEAALLGYNVVYITLELGEVYVGKRMDAYLTGIPVDKLKDHRQRVEESTADIKGRIKIKYFPAGRTSLDHVEAYLQRLESQDDFKCELLVIDYLDLLKNRGKLRAEKRDDLDDVYTDARGMAGEKKFPLISPSQVNRSGAQDDVIEADKIAGSYGKIMIGDFVVSLSRKRKDKKKGIGRFHIMGNRYGDDGLTYGAKVNTSNGDIEINLKPYDEDEEDEMIDASKPISEGSNIRNGERVALADRFFQIKNKITIDGEND